MEENKPKRAPKKGRVISYYRVDEDKLGSKINIPVVEVNDSEEHRVTGEKFIKLGNGRTSKFIPNRQTSEY